ETAHRRAPVPDETGGLANFAEHIAGHHVHLPLSVAEGFQRPLGGDREGNALGLEPVLQLERRDWWFGGDGRDRRQGPQRQRGASEEPPAPIAGLVGVGFRQPVPLPVWSDADDRRPAIAGPPDTVRARIPVPVWTGFPGYRSPVSVSAPEQSTGRQPVPR